MLNLNPLPGKRIYFKAETVGKGEVYNHIMQECGNQLANMIAQETPSVVIKERNGITFREITLEVIVVTEEEFQRVLHAAYVQGIYAGRRPWPAH